MAKGKHAAESVNKATAKKAAIATAVAAATMLTGANAALAAPAKAQNCTPNKSDVAEKAKQQSALSQAETAARNAHDAYTAAEAKRAEAAKKLGDLAKNSKDAENNYNDVEAARKAQAAKLGQLARDSKAAEENYKAIEAKRAEAAKKLGDLAKAEVQDSKALKQLTDAHSESEQAKAALDNVVNELGQAYSAYVPDNYDSVLQTVEAQKDSDTTDYNNAQSARKSNAKKIQDLAKKIADFDGYIKRDKAQLETLKNNQADLDQKAADLAAKAPSTADLSTATKNHNIAANAVATQQNHVNRAQAHLNNANDAVTKAEHTLHVAQAQVKADQAQNAKHQELANKAQAIFDGPFTQAARDYRAGRITLEQLKAQQQAYYTARDLAAANPAVDATVAAQHTAAVTNAQTAVTNAQNGVTSAKNALDAENAKLARFQQAEQRTNDRLKALNKAASDAAAARTAAEDNKRAVSNLSSQITGETNEQNGYKTDRQNAQKASKGLVDAETKAKKSLDQSTKDLDSLKAAHSESEQAKAVLDNVVNELGQAYNAYVPDNYDSVLQTVQSAYDSSKSARQAAAKKASELALDSKDAEENYKAIEANRQDEAAKLGQMARDSKAAEDNYKAIEAKRAEAAKAQGDLAKASKSAEDKFDAAEAVRKSLATKLANFKVREDCVVPGKVVVKAGDKNEKKAGLAETGADSLAAVTAAVVLLSAGTGLALSRKND